MDLMIVVIAFFLGYLLSRGMIEEKFVRVSRDVVAHRIAALKKLDENSKAILEELKKELEADIKKIREDLDKDIKEIKETVKFVVDETDMFRDEIDTIRNNISRIGGQCCVDDCPLGRIADTFDELDDDEIEKAGDAQRRVMRDMLDDDGKELYDNLVHVRDNWLVKTMSKEAVEKIADVFVRKDQDGDENDSDETNGFDLIMKQDVTAVASDMARYVEELFRKAEYYKDVPIIKEVVEDIKKYMKDNGSETVPLLTLHFRRAINRGRLNW